MTDGLGGNRALAFDERLRFRDEAIDAAGAGDTTVALVPVAGSEGFVGTLSYDKTPRRGVIWVFRALSE